MTQEAIITPENNGPYYVKGTFQIVTPSGQVLQTNGETWLCRCGGSQNKPFCDGTHQKIGFRATEPAQSDGVAADAEGFAAVASAQELAEGDLLGVEVGGERVVVGRLNGQVYAIGGLCTHQGARLEEGVLDGEVVTCPLHNSGFNIKTGQAVRLPASEPVPRYQVKIVDDQILVGPPVTEAAK